MHVFFFWCDYAMRLFIKRSDLKFILSVGSAIFWTAEKFFRRMETLWRRSYPKSLQVHSYLQLKKKLISVEKKTFS